MFAHALAQKRPLDHSVYDIWQSIDTKLISDDGQWVAYSIQSRKDGSTLILECPDRGIKTEIPDGHNASFTSDSRHFIYLTRPGRSETVSYNMDQNISKIDSAVLTIVNLDNNQVAEVRNVSSYQVSPDGYQFLCYRSQNGLLIHSLIGRKELLILENIKKFEFSELGNKLYLESNKADSITDIMIYDFQSGTLDTITRTNRELISYVLTSDASKAALLLADNSSPQTKISSTSIWYYQQGMDKAKMLFNDDSSMLPANMKLSRHRELSFSKSGNRLFFGIAPLRIPLPPPSGEQRAKVDIWHYNDYNVQSMQLEPTNLRKALQKNFLSMYDFSKTKIVMLESEEVPICILSANADENVILVRTDYSKKPEWDWKHAEAKFDLYQINAQSGERQLVRKDMVGASFLPSPNGKYILWYSMDLKHYFVWNGSELSNITNTIKEPLYNVDYEWSRLPQPYMIMGWHEGDSAVYVYDQFDIWKVPLDTTAPINMTQGYGRKRGISLRHASKSRGWSNRVFKTEDTILLNAFDFQNMSSSIAVLKMNNNSKSNAVKRITIESPKMMGTDYLIDFITTAKGGADAIIYTKENYKSSPNLYYAKIVFEIGTAKETKLSTINPQQAEYVWGTSELIRWKAFNGKDAVGIIYKPENFNPSKAYPLICYYYEGITDELNRYVAPEPATGSPNISYFVSNGYIVFRPNIDYEIGQPCQDVYDYVVSGTRELIQRGLADSTSLGIIGSSFGGYETMCLITKTSLFRAAWASLPVSNLITYYSSLNGYSSPNFQPIEKVQYRMKGNLWDNTSSFIKNSPFFYFDKVTTPLVVLSNDNDPKTKIEYGIEIFLGLRRLRKEVWLLNYNGERHGVFSWHNRIDLQIRMQQFFDYKLKGVTPTKWIIHGVPAVRKGFDWGLDTVK